MPRRVPSLVALAGAAAVAALPSAAAAADAADSVRARFTKYEYRIPMRDGVKLFTSVYVPKDAGALQALSDPAQPHALQRRALRQRRLPRQRGPLGSGGEGGVHLRLPGRAGPLHVGGPVRGRAALQPRQGAEGRGRVERHLGHDRLAAEERPLRQRQGRGLGHLVPRLLRGDGGDRRPPGARRRLAPGAHRRLVHRRRLPPQRRLLPAARLQLLHRASASPAPSRPRSGRRASTTAPPTATSSSSGPGPCRTSTGSTSRATWPSGRRSWRTRATTPSGRPATPGRT